MINKRYLITGGLGFIGSSIANKLEGDINIVSRSKTNIDRIKINKYNLQIKSIFEITNTDLEKIDVIYHCASTVDNYNILTDPNVDTKTNILGLINLLEKCKNLTQKPKIIFLSTFFVYGNIFDKAKISINEESQTDPLALYPISKLCAENILKVYAKLYKISFLICRLTNVYGENESYDNKKKGALNYLIMQAVKGKPIDIYKGGNFFRDYIHVDDVVSALQFLENKVSNETFLIGYGKSIWFKTLIKYILNKTDNKSTITKIDPPEFHKIVGIGNFRANTSKLNNYGWKPKISPKAGIIRVVEKYKKLNFLKIMG